jgi:hypothetical protein
MDVQDFDRLIFAAIRRDVRQWREYQFAGAFLAAWTPSLRIIFQGTNAVVISSRSVAAAGVQRTRIIAIKSGPEHSLDSRFHLFFFDQLAALRLLNPFAHAGAKLSVILQQFQGGILYKFVRIDTLSVRDGRQARFLFRREMDFHAC